MHLDTQEREWKETNYPPVLIKPGKFFAFLVLLEQHQQSAINRLTGQSYLSYKQCSAHFEMCLLVSSLFFTVCLNSCMFLESAIKLESFLVKLLLINSDYLAFTQKEAWFYSHTHKQCTHTHTWQHWRGRRWVYWPQPEPRERGEAGSFPKDRQRSTKTVEFTVQNAFIGTLLSYIMHCVSFSPLVWVDNTKYLTKMQ